MGEIQLDGGWLPIVVFVAAPRAIALAFGWTTGAWKRQLVIGVPVAAIGGLLVYAAESHFDLVPYAFPTIFCLWVAVVIFAATIAIVGWRRDHWARRLVSLFATLAADIETCVQVKPGAHNFEFWSLAFRNSLPWLTDRLGLRPTSGPSPVPCSTP